MQLSNEVKQYIILQLSARWPGLWKAARLQTSLLLSCKSTNLTLEQHNLHNRSSELVCIKKGSPPALLPFKDLACVSRKIRKLLGPGNHPAKLPKRLSGVSQSTRKILSPKNMSFFPVNFTGTHYLPKSIFGSVFLVLA